MVQPRKAQRGLFSAPCLFQHLLVQAGAEKAELFDPEAPPQLGGKSLRFHPVESKV